MSDPNGPAGNGEYGSGGPGPDLTGQPGWTPRYRPTEAIGYGWRKFKASPSMLLVPMIVVVLVLVVVGLIFAFVAGGGFFGTTSCSASNINGQVSTECGQPFWRQLLGAGLGVALLSLVGQVLLAGLFRGATLVTEGKDFSLGQLLEGYSKTHVILASIFISVATGIATVLCYLPGVLIAFLTSYTLFFIVDQQLEAAEAIAESVKMALAQLRQRPALLHPRGHRPGHRRAPARHRPARSRPGRGVRARLHLPTTAGSAGRPLTPAVRRPRLRRGPPG